MTNEIPVPNLSWFNSTKQSGLLTILSIAYAAYENLITSGSNHYEQLGSLATALLLSLKHTDIKRSAEGRSQASTGA